MAWKIIGRLGIQAEIQGKGRQSQGHVIQQPKEKDVGESPPVSDGSCGTT